jgi:hypothetical protein
MLLCLGRTVLRGPRALPVAKAVVVRLDRVQILSGVLPGQKLPELEGYKIVRDSFVRCQTTTATYARCRQYRSMANDSRIYWQYQRLKGWLAPWKITLVADDKSGLSRCEIEAVLKHCRDYRFQIVEIAVDFSPAAAGVNSQFIRRHAVFGKSRYRTTTKG